MSYHCAVRHPSRPPGVAIRGDVPAGLTTSAHRVKNEGWHESLRLKASEGYTNVDGSEGESHTSSRHTVGHIGAADGRAEPGEPPDCGAGRTDRSARGRAGPRAAARRGAGAASR